MNEKKSAAPRVAIVGGGYGGVAVAIELNRLGLKHAATLFDARPVHQKLTQWHKLARGRMAERYEVPFTDLSRRFHFDFKREHIDIETLLKSGAESLGSPFDFVVIAQGSQSPSPPNGVIDLDSLRDKIAVQNAFRIVRHKNIFVVGGGPTGVQFAFEFAERQNRVTLIEARDRLLPSFDNALSEIALREAASSQIDVRLGSEFLAFQEGVLRLREGAIVREERADMVLFVPGVRSTPSFVCDTHGRIEGIAHKNFYAVGDNSYFSGPGLNSKSGQAAVRKGQHVARAIRAAVEGKEIPPYTYAEIGYFVSLGSKEAVGYLLSQKTTFSGRAALAMKEVVEQQYNLFLRGFNVYL